MFQMDIDYKVVRLKETKIKTESTMKINHLMFSQKFLCTRFYAKYFYIPWLTEFSQQTSDLFIFMLILQMKKP